MINRGLCNCRSATIAVAIVTIGILSLSITSEYGFAFSLGGTLSRSDLHISHGHSDVRFFSSSSSNDDSSPAEAKSNTQLLDDVKRSAMKLGENIIYECNEVSSILGRTLKLSWKQSVGAEDVVRICDEIDAIQKLQLSVGRKVTARGEKTYVSLTSRLNMEQRALRYARTSMLRSMMKENYDTYITTATFLSNRIPRRELPNVQDIPYPQLLPAATTTSSSATVVDENGLVLVLDCSLDKVAYSESILDKFLLKIFRDLVEKNTGGIRSDKPGIQGLLEQGRTFMVQEGQTPEAMHQMVYNTLGGLMTPYLPPFYRIFMSGILPKGFLMGLVEKDQTLGPWFYAPWLTSLVTPTFFGFLVGPSYPNARKDGHPGGLLVEKCKFLQESGCKGLCLHQCKIPAQKVRM
jgi:hypothetical protein